MPKYSRPKREEARRLYLTNEISTVAEIARHLKVKPHTIAAWKREEDWDGLRREIERRAAEKLVEQLAGERVQLNARHFKFWDIIGSRLVESVKKDRLDAEGIKSLDRLAAIVERMQKGQRLARGLSLDGATEEQIRAQAEADGRGLIDTFMEVVKAEVPDEAARDRIVQALLPGCRSDEEGIENAG